MLLSYSTDLGALFNIIGRQVRRKMRHKACSKNSKTLGFVGHYLIISIKGCLSMVHYSLKKVDSNGRTTRSTLDASTTSNREQSENKWIKSYERFSSYGLNDEPGDDLKK